jgi:hypothetical protein
MKKLVALLALIAVGLTADPRLNQLITITSGTPIQLSKFHLYASEILIQMATGGTGLGYVCAGIPLGTTPAASCGTAGQLSAQLSPASSTAPGGYYADQASAKGGPGIDLATIWIDGSHTGDTVIVTYLQQN